MFGWHNVRLFDERVTKKRSFNKLCLQTTFFIYADYEISVIFLWDLRFCTKPTKSTSNRLGFFWSVCLLIFVGPVDRFAGRPSIRRRLVVGLLTTLITNSSVSSIFKNYDFVELKKSVLSVLYRAYFTLLGFWGSYKGVLVEPGEKIV